MPRPRDGAAAMEAPAAELVAMAVAIEVSPDDLHRMFARYGAIKSLRCIRDTTARTTKRVQVTYEKAISVKLALRSELLKPLDLRRGEDVDGRARKRQQRTLPKSRTFAYVSSHVPEPDGVKRSRSVEPWRVIASEPIDNFVELHRSASAMEGVGDFGRRVNSWLPPIVRNRVSVENMDAVRAGVEAERSKPRVRIDPETKQMISRREQTEQELPDEMATMRDPSASEHAQAEPSKARKMLKQAITKSYKERLRRYGEEWHKADRAAPKPLGDGPSVADVAVNAMRKHAKDQQLEYTVLGEL